MTQFTPATPLDTHQYQVVPRACLFFGAERQFGSEERDNAVPSAGAT
jgi:hypothetical protein